MAFGDFTVTRASTKNVLGDAGLYVSVANDTPAFEFNTDGSYRGLLVEPGATNLALHSQEFDNAYWTKQELTITPNATTAPDGTTTAEFCVPTAVSSAHQISRTGFASGVYTMSVFAKANGYTTIEMGLNSAANRALFNLATGAVSSVTGVAVATIEDYGDGWYRCSVYSSVAGTDYRVYVPTTSASFVGDGTSGVYLWQAQLETGSVATSPIVTTAGTASRVADVVSLTGASSLIGQTEGTLYVEIDTRSFGSNRRILDVALDVNTDRITIQKGNGNDTLQGIVVVGNVTQALISGTATASGIFKIAFAYKADDFAMYVNGVQSGTDTSGTVPAAISIGLGNSITGGASFNDHISSVALFPTRLANATLESITTL
jgi:hypothetical protein